MTFWTTYIRQGLTALGTAVLIATAPQSVAQETQYISDMVLVPVRSGPSTDYRIVNRGLPSGTALLVYDLSDDGEWTEIETRGGTRGWIPTQYLQKEPPAPRSTPSSMPLPAATHHGDASPRRPADPG